MMGGNNMMMQQQRPGMPNQMGQPGMPMGGMNQQRPGMPNQMGGMNPGMQQQQGKGNPGMQQGMPQQQQGKGMQPQQPQQNKGAAPQPGAPGAPQAQAGAGLNAAMLANAPPGMQKQMLGEKLYPAVSRLQPELAGKITGMMLEMDNSELLMMLESEAQLRQKVDEAMRVLQQMNK